MTNDGIRIPMSLKKKLIGAAIVAVLAVFSALKPDSANEFGQRDQDQAAPVTQRAANRHAKPSEADTETETGKGVDSWELRDVGNRVKVSPAGLEYRSGSQEGHRLDHVLRHDNDMPDRPGKHGVFDGDQTDMLKVIDEAWKLVQKKSNAVRTSRERGREIHDVDLKRRIGYVGGQVGNDRGKPDATHIRLIVEGASVITAYPY